MSNDSTPTEVECGPCAFTAIHHHWPHSDMSHCRHCHATWRIGTRTIHCVICHETFTTPGNLDAHKTTGNACVPPGSLVDGRGQPRLRAEPNAWGTLVWRSAVERPATASPTEAV